LLPPSPDNLPIWRAQVHDRVEAVEELAICAAQLFVDISAPHAVRVFVFLQFVDWRAKGLAVLRQSAQAPAVHDNRLCRSLNYRPRVTRKPGVGCLVETRQLD